MENSLTSDSGHRLYRLAVGFTIAFSLLHLISLPVAISYDGLIYIDMANVLGSSRFPHDWNPARTPLFPLYLKFSFWLFGRQPLAVILVSTSLGLGGTLLLGGALRKMLGATVAAIVVIILTLFPLFVAFQHFALTEVGTAFFLILITVLLLYQPTQRRRIWLKAIGLMAVCSVGYYWRQAILSLAPVVALLHGVGSLSDYLAYAESRKPEINRRWRLALPVLAQIALIAILPFWFAKPWSKYTNEPGMRDVTLRQGMLRQALLPADHPYVGAHAGLYRKAIEDSVYDGKFYSGLRADLLGSVSAKIFSTPIDKPVVTFYWELVRHNPGRYLAGVARTLILFAGVKALQNENLTSQEMILSPALPDSKIGQGPAELSWVKDEFLQKTRPCVVLNILWMSRAALRLPANCC